VFEKQALDDHTQAPTDQRCQDQREPVFTPHLSSMIQALNAPSMYSAPCAKVHDVQQAEDHRQTQAEHGVERAVDQAQQAAGP
jgi:hypothetical protein